MGEPLVSVVIPTYNAPDLLLETLASVLAQSYRDFEVVIVNDGSTDDTQARLEREVTDPRVRIVQQVNGGIGVARNRGIDEARGKYIALLDHDDLWKADKLKVQVAFAEAHPECAIVTVPWAMSTQPHLRTAGPEVQDAEGKVAGPLGKIARGSMLFCSSSMMFERSKFAGLRYGEVRQCIEDQEVHLGLLGRGKLGIAGEEILMIYRWHATNYSSNALYWYNGVRRLRRLDREGVFAAVRAKEGADVDAFLSHFGRTATAFQLTAGAKLRAIKLYLEEFRHQLREGRLKFLLAVPVLAAAPKSWSQRWLKGGH